MLQVHWERPGVQRVLGLRLVVLMLGVLMLEVQILVAQRRPVRIAWIPE
jgi:hypothetical protein